MIFYYIFQYTLSELTYSTKVHVTERDSCVQEYHMKSQSKNGDAKSILT